MALWLKPDGTMKCAAHFSAEDGDVYIDDRHHHRLVVSDEIETIAETIGGELWCWKKDKEVKSVAKKEQPQEGLTEELGKLKLETEILRVLRFFFSVTTAAIDDKISKGEQDLFIAYTLEMMASKLRTLGYSSPQEVKEQVKQARREDTLQTHAQLKYYLKESSDLRSDLWGYLASLEGELEALKGVKKEG